jgi:ATP-dependent helicase/nuclease subunit B
MGMAQRIVIVPEQLSHQTEWSLSELCGDQVSFVSEVLSFTRLYSRVCSICGGGARAILDQGGRILTARLALSSVLSQLKVFASAAGKAEFLSSVVSMIDEFKSYDVSPSQLMEASRKATGLFSEKLRELSLILGAYEAVSAQGAADPRDQLTLLKNKLRDGDYAKERYFFVDGFTDFSAQELGVLRELLRQSQNMTVTVPCDSLEGEDSLFAPGRETANRLKALAQELGQPVEIVYTMEKRQLPPELTYLEENLFSYGAMPYAGKTTYISVSSQETVLEECRRCGAVLRQHAMEGMRFREMAICVGDEKQYGPVLETVLGDMDIPFYRTEKTQVLAHPAVGFILLALEAATENLETETVLAYLKTGCSGLGADDCDAIENYALTWGIRGSKWQKKWTMHPEGYDGRFTGDTEAELLHLNEVKDQAIAPILHLKSRIQTAANTLSQVEAIYLFLEETRLYEHLELSVQQDTQAGRLSEAQETAQIWSILLGCLQQIAQVLGTLAQRGEELLRVFRLALGQYEVGTIPATLDSVSFGTVSSMRGQEPKLLCILGALEGVMPGTANGGSLLSERERAILRDNYQIGLAPDSEGAMERDLLQIYGAFTAPTQGLYVTYPETEGTQPSFLVSRLNRLFPNRRERSYLETGYTAQTATETYLGVTDEIILRAAIQKAAQEITDLAQAIALGKAGAVERDMQVSRLEAEKLFGQPVSLTASRLDKLGNCPLDFFLNYGMKARPRKEASFDAAEFGTFVHYILEKTVGELTRDTKPLSREQSAQMVEGYLEDYAAKRLGGEEQTSRDTYLFYRNSQEATVLLEEISQELSQSDFVPCAFELGFGSGGSIPAPEAIGKNGVGRLSGFVDRADLWKSPWGDYLRVIDYKSGTKKFDYTELYGGVGMQMLLYLFALESSGIPDVTEQPIPAGVLYVPAKRAYVSEDAPEEDTPAEAKITKRSGIVLDEEPVLDAMEHGDGFQYLPLKKQKAGGYGDFAISRQQLDLLKEFVQKRMGEAVDQILSGQFAPRPFYRGRSHDPCSYCDYGEVCQKSPEFRKAYYQEQLSADEFWAMLGGKEDE